MTTPTVQEVERLLVNAQMAVRLGTVWGCSEAHAYLSRALMVNLSLRESLERPADAQADAVVRLLSETDWSAA